MITKDVSSMSRKELIEHAALIGFQVRPKDSTEQIRKKIARTIVIVETPPVDDAGEKSAEHEITPGQGDPEHPGFVIQKSDEHKNLFEVLDLSKDEIVFNSRHYEVCESWIEGQDV